MTVDGSFAEYLQGLGYWTPLAEAATKALWGELARESSFMSPIDAKADADTEVARQLTFLKFPIVLERIGVAALDIRDTYRGHCITLKVDAPGYQGDGALVFVLGGTEDRTAGITTLFVLRKLS